MKNSKNMSFFLIAFLFLPGCLYKKEATEMQKKGKKTALVDGAKGIPLSHKKDEGKFFDSGVEAFVLGEEDVDDDLRQFVQKEMILAQADIEAQSPEWKVDAGFNKQDFEPIYFSFDDHSIREDQKPTLEYDVKQAKQAASKGAVAVTGHSDSHYVSEVYNIAKSEKRARQVAKKFEQAGIPKGRIKVIGYGDKQKAINVAGKEEKNRRVELIKLTQAA
ncbi:MAG: OmpA family protein [Candidatus Babeliales bacterium]|jgi:outer membrane protein OmpA-like peptidoglycan-associated protein